MIDIEDVPGIQLEHGEDAGDAVLAHIAGLVCAPLDDVDLAARIGESQFAILLVGRGLGAAQALIASLKQQLSLPLDLQGHAPLRVSIRSGAAQLRPGTGSLGQLIKQIHATTPAAESAG